MGAERIVFLAKIVQPDLLIGIGFSLGKCQEFCVNFVL
jgi:hypothetical protein